MSLAKNLRAITAAAPRPIITWDKVERIRRHEEIWENKDSIVHRLPEHYKRRPSSTRYSYDPVRNVEVESEIYPIIGLRPVEADQGLWGGEGVVKGWIESRPYTKKKVLARHWVPRLFFPYLKRVVFYSEILNKHMAITVTERACRLIDASYGIDYYILRTPEIDLASKLGCSLKREMLLTLAKEKYYEDDAEKHEYIKHKYAEFVIPAEEAEWVGLELNDAARKQQDIEESQKPLPLKHKLEQELVERLRQGEDLVTLEEDFVPKTEESKFGEKLLGQYLNPLAKKFRG